MTYDYFGMCITMFEEVDEIFYSFYTYKNEYEEDANLIPLFPGHYDYYDKNISVIPIIPEDFNSLTYKIYTYQEKTKAYIINCETYPFCNLDLNNKNNIKELEKLYDTYFITFNKNELESNWSPINKKQHVIVFECDNSNSVDKCEMNLEIYTDKTQLNLIYDAISNYYFIQKGNINNFILSIYSSKKIIIEKIAGDILIQKMKLNNDIYNYNNMYLYEYDGKEEFIGFQIKAEKNSIYHIINYDESNLKLRGNYILNLNDNNDNNTKTMSLQKYSENIHEIELPNYFSIYPIKCNINISLEFEEKQKTEILPLQLNHGFYQNISYIPKSSSLSRYISIQKLDEKDSCMVFLSYFLLEDNSNNNHFLDSGLILSENIARSFLFNKDYKEIKYYFFHTNINNNLTLELNLLNEGVYQIGLFVNDVKIDGQSIESNETIHLEKDKWKSICTESHHICILSFIINSHKDSDSFLEIKIKVVNDNNEKKETNNNIFIIILVTVGLILIVVIIILILKCLRKNAYSGDNRDSINNVDEQEGETELLDKTKD